MNRLKNFNDYNLEVIKSKIKPGEYAVFDCDETCIYNDVQEVTIMYQLENFIFNIDPDDFYSTLTYEITDLSALLPKGGEVGSFIEKLSRSYRELYETRNLGSELHKDFIVKMRYLYNNIYEIEEFALPWESLLLVGMTPYEVGSLARSAIKSAVELGRVERVSITSPISSEYTVEYRRGIVISKDIQELVELLKASGVSIYIISASFRDVVVELFTNPNYGYNISPENVFGGIREVVDGKYVREYSWENSCYRDGKTYVIKNILHQKFGRDPILIAGDSSGDYHMMKNTSAIALIINRFHRNDEMVELYRLAGEGYGKLDNRFLLQNRDEENYIFVKGGV